VIESEPAPDSEPIPERKPTADVSTESAPQDPAGEVEPVSPPFIPTSPTVAPDRPFEVDLANFTGTTVKAIIEHLKGGRMLSKCDVHALLDRAISLHEPLPNIVSIDFPETKVVGDTHGQFQDLLYIFDTFGFPSATNPYLFNGDYVDRGSQGVEIVLTLFAIKIANPGSIFLNRGNQYSSILTPVRATS
jgi:hypothetical protein